MTHDKIVEQEARQLCREMDMPEHVWPAMANTISCAVRVLRRRMVEFTAAVEAEGRRLRAAARMQ